MTLVTCPNCDGDGYTIELTGCMRCCGSYEDDGLCCGNGVPEEERLDCSLCYGTGHIEKDFKFFRG
jgi:hypothetical protein